jgi:SAM-dependent methyltransferase
MLSPSSAHDLRFAGSIPELHDRFMVPLVFEPYAADLLGRLAPRRPRRVLEVAAGTGVVTRALAAGLVDAPAIVATDLNPAMLERAKAVGTRRPVEWQPADAQALPFADASFDAVVCQFGVMFFPDRPRAFAEARRILGQGGVFLFNVWDRLALNELADVITDALAAVFPADPPRFMARTPHGYHDPDAIVSDLGAGGFAARPEIDVVAARSRAATARDAAVAICQGTPVRHEIEARDPARLEEATAAAAEAVAARFGPGPVDAALQALVVTVATR